MTGKKGIVLVVATRNAGKIAEIGSFLKDFPVRVKSLDDFGPIPPIVEDGATFEENAYKKANLVSRVLGFPALADDSGLTVEALGGEPGVYSARYAGENATDPENCRKLLSRLEGVENRKAAFECVLSLAVPTGQALTYTGRCEGWIARSPSGKNGFGYDPVFFYPPLGKTFAEMDMAEKARVSHRGMALRELKEEFGNVMKWVEIHWNQMP